MVLTVAPRSVTGRLQPVLNAAARLVILTHNDRRLSQLLHDDLYWLDVADRVRSKLAITVHRCLHNKVPMYLTDCCVDAGSDIAGRQRLRSAHRRQLMYRAINVQHSAVGRSLSLEQPTGLVGAENAGPENVGPENAELANAGTKMQGWKMQDWTMRE